MTRNLKALGLALLAVLALGAIGAQGASAAHKFHSDGPKTIITGENINVHTFAVGAVGIVECKKLSTQSAGGAGTEVSAGTYASNTVTMVPQYQECTFGGQPTTINFNHCAFVLYGETTAGNSTGSEHANLELECEGPENQITIHTVNCTITMAPQLVKDAVRYENESGVPSATRTITTAHGIVAGKVRSTASQPLNGCLTFPTGAYGAYKGTTTNKCFKDEREKSLEGTEKTTPPATGEGATTNCTVSGAPTV